jgi:hypothetical protein
MSINTKIIYLFLTLILSLHSNGEPAEGPNRISTGIKINEEASVYVKTIVSISESDKKEYWRIMFGFFRGYEFEGEKSGTVFYEINSTDKLDYSWEYEGGWILIKHSTNKNTFRVRTPKEQ